MFALPLTSEDIAVLQFTQLRLAARALAAGDSLRSYTDARDAFESVRIVQQMMCGDDRVDSELISTVEENNDTLDQGFRAMARRAFVGLDHPVWGDPDVNMFGEAPGAVIDVTFDPSCVAGFNRNGCQCADCSAYAGMLHAAGVPRMCAFGCGLAADKGDRYCAGCRSSIS